MGDIWDANGVPNGLIYGSTVAKAIAGLATGISGDKLATTPPPVLDSATHYVSNHCHRRHRLSGGLEHRGRRIQALEPPLPGVPRTVRRPGQIGVAADLRADIAVMHPEHVSITPGIS